MAANRVGELHAWPVHVQKRRPLRLRPSRRLRHGTRPGQAGELSGGGRIGELIPKMLQLARSDVLHRHVFTFEAA